MDTGLPGSTSGGSTSNLFSKASGLCFPWDNKFFEIVGDPNWEVIAAPAWNLDTDTLVNEIPGNAQNVRDSVTELLSG